MCVCVLWDVPCLYNGPFNVNPFDDCDAYLESRRENPMLIYCGSVLKMKFETNNLRRTLARTKRRNARRGRETTRSYLAETR